MENENTNRVYYRLRHHLEMLNDTIRCLAYRDALSNVVKDKVVLDVGCGTGLLSFFAARSGAKQVFAVDMDLPPGVEQVAQDNGMASKITFIRGKIQDIILPVEFVDVIVSEWMGGLLLMENMLPAVLIARDRWLKSGGVLLPDKARLYLMPLRDVAGIDSEAHPSLRDTISSRIWATAIDHSRQLAGEYRLLDFDLTTVTIGETGTYDAKFLFEVVQSGIFNGFGMWFDVEFTQTNPKIILSTAPWKPLTHWLQSLWVLPRDIQLQVGEAISGRFSQKSIMASNITFATQVKIDSKCGSTSGSPIEQKIEASASCMNQAGGNESLEISKALSGDYKGLTCYWIGCSWSLSPLMAAQNGAQNVYVLNHSQWAQAAMKEAQKEQKVPNLYFLDDFPSPNQLQHDSVCLMGAADGSWQALVSHIRFRLFTGDQHFKIKFCREKNDWDEFYGFDFSVFSKYDLEMRIESPPLSNGGFLFRGKDDLLDSKIGINLKNVIFHGVFREGVQNTAKIAGSNCVRVDFHSGTVLLPLSEKSITKLSNERRSPEGRLVMSLCHKEILTVLLQIDIAGQSIVENYQQRINDIGHIMPNN